MFAKFPKLYRMADTLFHLYIVVATEVVSTPMPPL